MLTTIPTTRPVMKTIAISRGGSRNGTTLIAIEAAGTSSAIQTALEIVSGHGTLVSLGIIRNTEIDVLQVMRKNLTWIGVVSSVRRHFAEAIALVHAGKVSPRGLITHRLPLAEALTGFEVLRHREAVKVMFTPRV
jgi:threonine dehydrogenase-like Zn-dependent dehydrogenase